MNLMALDEMLDHRTTGAPSDRLAQCLLESRRVSEELVVLARLLEPRLAWRAEKLGSAIQDSLKDNFGGTDG